tara:strand:+ start:4130 stop:5563 length:1434 start_codon:yes stop_codon:yes gene_type:complete
MAYFEYTPSYGETVSTALSRGGSLFEAKNGYLEPGDLFRINNGSGYTKPANDLAQNTVGSTLKMAKKNRIGKIGGSSEFNKRIHSGGPPAVGDLYTVLRTDRVTGIFQVRNMIDGDNTSEEGEYGVLGEINITGPSSGQSFEADETVTVTGTASSDVVTDATDFKLIVETLDDDGQGEGTASELTVTVTSSWSVSFTPETLSNPITGNKQVLITIQALDNGTLINADASTIYVRPDGDALIATYGTVTPILNFLGEDAVNVALELPIVDNAGTVSTDITIPTNLDGAEAGNGRLLSDASIELLAIQKTLGVDFGGFWLMLYSSEPGVAPVAIPMGGDMNVRMGAGFNADGSYDNNDTGLSQSFQVMDTDFGGTAKMELISSTGTVTTISASVATSGTGTFTVSGIDLDTLGPGSTPIPAGVNYRIKVTSNTDDDMFAYGEYFTIKSSLASITVTSPANGSEQYFGDTVTVEWTSQTN